MRDYSAKFEDLLRLLNDESEQNSPQNPQRRAKEPEGSNNIDLVMNKLRLHELEREIINLKSILLTTVIPKLNGFEFQSVRLFLLYKGSCLLV